MTAYRTDRLLSLLPIGRALMGLRRIAFGTKLYDLSLGGRLPHPPVFYPPEPLNADGNQGAPILDGLFPLPGRSLDLGADPWGSRPEQLEILHFLHSFAWLKHLRALDAPNARDRARDLVGAWIARHDRWDAEIWAPDILGERLVAWLTLGHFLLDGCSSEFESRLLGSIARQGRHLARSLSAPGGTADRMSAGKGLAYLGLCLKGYDNALNLGLRVVGEDCERQVLADGVHISRNPSRHMAVLADLVDLRECLVAAQADVPGPIQNAIDRMAPALRGFRHGDGGLGLFNGSHEEDPAAIELLLNRSTSRGKPMARLPHGGYQRIGAARSLIIADVGAPLLTGPGRETHAGPLAFEFSVGRDRLIVNCGSAPPGIKGWRDALRATAAHSTLTVDDTNAFELDADGCPLPPLPDVRVSTREADGATWVEASHNGYVGRIGVVHERHLYLSADGRDLRGMDRVSGKGGRAFAVRFHLHPAVQASVTQDGKSVLLRTPHSGGWKMIASGGSLKLEESVYCGLPEGPRRSQQIVIVGPITDDGATVKWRLARLDG